MVQPIFVINCWVMKSTVGAQTIEEQKAHALRLVQNGINTDKSIQ